MDRRKASAAVRIEKAEEGLKRAQERLEKARAKAQKVESDATKLIEKQTAELKSTETKHADTVRRQQERAQAKPKKAKAAAGTVEAEDGRTFDLSADAVEAIKAVLGRRRKGMLSEDSAGAKKVLDTVGNVGDVFELTLKGRKTIITFSIEDDGLEFETTAK
jgi:hypothetical protein